MISVTKSLNEATNVVGWLRSNTYCFDSPSLARSPTHCHACTPTPCLVQVVCALQTHQPALAAAAGSVGTGTPAAEVPMLRFKVGRL